MIKQQMRTAAVLAALALPAAAAAQGVVWTPIARTPAPVTQASAATLGRPVPIASSRPATLTSTMTARGQAPDPEPPYPPPPPGEELTRTSATRPFTGDEDPLLGSGPARHTAAQPPGDVPPPDFQPGIVSDRPIGQSWWEKARCWAEWGHKGSATGRAGFQSDHCFDGLISPVTMPFYFEDPRALTEVRPIFMYQKVPGSNPYWNGGDLMYFGTQARIALSECFSVVLHDLGFFSFNPDTPVAPIQSGTGFAEVKLGPKFTFIRNVETGSAAAVGLIFEVPVGSGKVFQNTGDLALTPYLSYAQTLWRLPNGYGVLNFMGDMGYSFSTNNQRSEFFYTNLHLDYNVGGLNAFFPLVELNWIHYTKSGTNTNINSEGADLINFGSLTQEGKDYVSLAVGARYRFTDHIYAGAAIEFPVSNEKGLNDYRLTFDLIFRY